MNRIIVHFYGGLGNQMFQYAFFQYLRREGISASINTDYFNYRKSVATHASKYILNKIFINIKDFPVTNWKSKVIYSSDLFWTICRFLRKQIKRKQNIFETFDFVTKSNLEDHMGKTSLKHYKDYWQNIKYVKAVEDKVREDFTFNEDTMCNRNRECLNSIIKDESVSIHVRRGDYLQLNNRYGDICTEQYYIKAIELIKNQIDNPCFYIFSDDISWCENVFQSIKSKVFIDWNHGDDSYWDMFLMSKCKHNIIANSTFSWWGAYLNKSNNKCVILPKMMTSSHSSDDLLFEGCIQI